MNDIRNIRELDDKRIEHFWEMVGVPKQETNVKNMLEFAIPKVQELVDFESIEFFILSAGQGDGGKLIEVCINYWLKSPRVIESYDGMGYDYDIALFLAIESLLRDYETS